MKIIINGDDFGMNERCSLAIARAFREELITDTSMMANGEFFDDAVALARAEGFDDRIGIHLNITEGEPLTKEIAECPRLVTDGRFNRRNDRLTELTKTEQNAICAELSAQVERMESAGIRITHADSHHYIHNAEHIAPIVVRVCREHGIGRLRLHMNLGGFSTEDMVRINAYNQWLREEGFVTTSYFGRYREFVHANDSGANDSGANYDGIVIPDRTELLVHPDFDRDGELIDRVGMADGYPIGERITAFNADNIELIGYAQLA